MYTEKRLLDIVKDSPCEYIKVDMDRLDYAYIEVDETNYNIVNGVKNQAVIFTITKNKDYQKFIADCLKNRTDISIMCAVEDTDWLDKSILPLEMFDNIAYSESLSALGLMECNLIVGDKEKFNYYNKKAREYAQSSYSFSRFIIDDIKNTDIIYSDTKLVVEKGTVAYTISCHVDNHHCCGMYLGVSDVSEASEEDMEQLINFLRNVDSTMHIVFFSSDDNYPKALDPVVDKIL